MLTLFAATRSAVLHFRYYRIFGRFYRLRRVVSAIRGLVDYLQPQKQRKSPSQESLEWAKELRSCGLSLGPRLDPAAAASVLCYARESLCPHPRTSEKFSLEELRDGLTPRGLPAPVVDVVTPLGCDEVRAVVEDERLLATVQRALGYWPRRIRVRLFWSLVSDLPWHVRQANGQTLTYHYDIEACNSIYAYFYLAGGDSESGAHVVVLNSHRPKPASMIFSTCFKPDEVVLRKYGTQNVKVISLPPGSGFLEDPACFHKALVPIREARLCLQVRYA